MGRRLRHHLLLLGTSAGALLAGYLLLPYASAWERISVASAWSCMVLLSAALLLGPMLMAQRAVRPLNNYLRRDIGFWTVLQGFLHFYAGTVVAMNDTYVTRFVNEIDRAPAQAVREQLFSWGSIAGLLVGIIFLVLLAISSDRALRWLGSTNWKRLQKSAYAALWLSLVHALAFQVLEYRLVPLALMVLLTAAVVLVRSRAIRAR